MPRLSVASVYLLGGSEVHPIPLFFLRKRASALRLRTDLAEEKTAYRAGKGGSLGNIRDRKWLKTAGKQTSQRF